MFTAKLGTDLSQPGNLELGLGPPVAQVAIAGAGNLFINPLYVIVGSFFKPVTPQAVTVSVRKAQPGTAPANLSILPHKHTPSSQTGGAQNKG